VFDNTVVSNDTETVIRFIRGIVQRLGTERSLRLVAGVVSQYQPTKGQVCQLALSYLSYRVTCTVISRRLGSPDGASLHGPGLYHFSCGLLFVAILLL